MSDVAVRLSWSVWPAVRRTNHDAPPSAAPRSSKKYTVRDRRIERISLVPPQHVTFAPARQDERRVVALVDLGPQVADVDVDDVGGGLVVLVVEVFPDHGAGG